MRRSSALPLAALAALAAAPLAAQTSPALPAAPSSPAAPAAAPSAAPATPARSAVDALGTANFESGTLLKVIDKAFNTDSDAFNPEDGTITYKGHTYNVGQMRVFRARFERYLSQPESVDDEVYAGTLKQIFELLSTRGGAVGEENLKSAWQLLYRAAEYPEDGGASLAVANQVFNAWRIRDEKAAFSIAQLELDRIRRQQRIDVSYGGDNLIRDGAKNVTSGVQSASDQAAQNASSVAAAPQINIGNSTGDNSTGAGANQQQRRQRNNSASNTNANQTEQTGAIAQLFRTRELAETEAKIQALSASSALTGVQAKLQFQTALVNLFLQRRFQHCLIASSFYRFTFKGTAQELEVGKKEIQSFLPSSDLAITVETLEFLSREAINDTDAAMQSVRASYDDGHLVGALERLQETFFLGEYLPPVTRLEREKKQVLLNLYRQIDQARKLADLKDYDAVDKLVAEIDTTAKDFRSNEALSAIRSAQRMSTLAIHAARQALVSQDFEAAQENVRRAAEIWPLNPDLQRYTESLAEKVDLGAQAAQRFDEAIKRGDWRRIYDDKVQLGMALLTDSARRPELEKIIEKISMVELFLKQSQEMVAQNNVFAAWEALQAASDLAPNDLPVNQRRAELAPRVAAFVGKLDAARRHEEAGRHAAALTQYLAAQGIYPASAIARAGVERVSARLLDDIAGESAPAPAGS